MPKVVDDSNHKTWIISQHNSGCCYAGIDAFHHEKDIIDNEIYVGGFGFDARSYYSGWKGKLRAIWQILRGKKVYEDMWFYERKDAENFRNELNEAIDFAFGKEEPKSYGGTELCSKCHKIVSLDHTCLYEEEEN